ncbi:hypothetical protein BTVI_18692 [Pitangus sulphuratus]|nr:hypothetical protein BTVI_18692 [Pitangus sulphuratus]
MVTGRSACEPEERKFHSYLQESEERRTGEIQDTKVSNHGKFNKGKYWILHLGWGNLRCSYRLGNEMLESSAMERGLGVLVDGKLNMSQQCPGSQEANYVLGGIRQSITNWLREAIVPLCSTLGWPHLEYFVQFWALQYKKDIQLLESVQRRAMEMVKGLEGKPYEEQLMSLDLFSLEKRRLRGDLTAITSSLWGEEEGQALISSLWRSVTGPEGMA